jgi:hypothetical protein
LTGAEDEDEDPEKPPYVEPPRGLVDDSAQSYLSPAGADEGDEEPEPQQPGSVDTQAYMKPIPPPTLAQPAAFADHSADTAAMTAQKQAESQQNIKPSVGRRILAGLAGGAVAFGGGDGAGTVEKVLDRPAQRAQQQWALQEAPIQAKLNADQAADAATTRANAVTEQQNRLAEQNYRNQSLSQQNAAHAADFQAQAEQRRNAITGFTPDDPADPYAGGTGTTADGRTVKGVPPPDAWISRWAKTPQGQLATQQMTLKQRTAAADQIGLKGTDRTDFLANGKISQRTPRQPSAGEVAQAKATAVYTQENGHPPQTLQDFNDIAQAAKGMLGGASGSPATPETAIQQHLADKANYMAGLRREDDGSYTDLKTLDKVTPEQVAARLEKFRGDLNNSYVMRKSGTMVNEKGETVSNRFSRNPQTAPAATLPPSSPNKAPAAAPAPTYKAKSGATVTVGTHVVVNGRPGVVDSFDANGKPVVKY